MKKIKVQLGRRSYYIYAGYNILPYLYRMLKGRRGAVITDRNVYACWKKEIERLRMPVCCIPPGERQKSMAGAEKVYRRILSFGMDRQCIIVAFGGGVVGDLAGFAAATYMRGIPYVQVPTTVVAQVDSSIGGKTGIDLPEGKNLIGCFHQPDFVFTDVKFLKTLPKRVLADGLAEVIKYGIIKDRELFAYLEKKGRDMYKKSPAVWMPVIIRCAEIKARIVSRDEKETKGLRLILNYGHTIGHALESMKQYRGITHGEAVAAGMIKAAEVSAGMGYLKREDAERQINLIRRLVGIRGQVSLKGIDMRRDKKNISGRIRFVLSRGTGRVFVTEKVNIKKYI